MWQSRISVSELILWASNQESHPFRTHIDYWQHRSQSSSVTECVSLPVGWLRTQRLDMLHWGFSGFSWQSDEVMEIRKCWLTLSHVTTTSSFHCFLTSKVAGIKGMFLANKKTDNQVKTYITYNRGRDWRLLQAPSRDLRGSSIHCVLVSVLNSFCWFP